MILPFNLAFSSAAAAEATSARGDPLLQRQKELCGFFDRLGPADLKDHTVYLDFYTRLKLIAGQCPLYSEGGGGFKERVDAWVRRCQNVAYCRNPNEGVPEVWEMAHPRDQTRVLNVFHRFMGALLFLPSNQERFKQEHEKAKTGLDYQKGGQTAVAYRFWEQYIIMLKGLGKSFIDSYKRCKDDFDEHGSKSDYMLKIKQVSSTGCFVLPSCEEDMRSILAHALQPQKQEGVQTAKPPQGPLDYLSEMLSLEERWRDFPMEKLIDFLQEKKITIGQLLNDLSHRISAEEEQLKNKLDAAELFSSQINKYKHFQELAFTIVGRQVREIFSSAQQPGAETKAVRATLTEVLDGFPIAYFIQILKEASAPQQDLIDFLSTMFPEVAPPQAAVLKAAPAAQVPEKSLMAKLDFERDVKTWTSAERAKNCNAILSGALIIVGYDKYSAVALIWKE